MTIRRVRPEEAEARLGLRMSLWPETDEPQHREEMAMMLSDEERFAVLVCQDPRGELAGFADVSLRAWAEGCESSPVRYLEGWYVAEPDANLHPRSGRHSVPAGQREVFAPGR